MSERKPKWDMLTDDQKQKLLDEVISFFNDERGETIGVIAAQDLIDFLWKQQRKIFTRKVSVM